MADPNPRNSVNWDIQEGGHRGQWTRDGEGGKDEQRFIHFAGDQMKIHYAGNYVYVERYKPGDLHFYHGTISSDKRSITGKYLISSIRGEHSWSAQINY